MMKLSKDKLYDYAALLPLPGKPEKLPFEYSLNGKKYTGLPAGITEHTENKDGITYIYTHPEGLRITLRCTVNTEYPVLEWEGLLENTSGSEIGNISNVRIGCFEYRGDTELVWSNGDNRREEGFEIFHERITSDREFFPAEGCSCSGAAPYMRLLGSGYGVNIGIGWTGMWNMLLKKTAGGVGFSVGQKRLDSSMLPGEIFRTPKITMMGFKGGESVGVNMWRSYYFDCITPKVDGKPLPPTLFMHNWCAEGLPEFTGATEENQLKALRKYVDEKVRPDCLWIDAGWYPCNGDWTATGTWHCDMKRFPHTLKAVSDGCAEEGTSLLLWFEPERVRKGTELYNEHPEWLLSAPGMGDSLLNLADPEAVKWITDKVSGLLREYGVSIYRQDFNTDALPFWEVNEPDGRKGSLENHYIQGLLAYWDGLLAENPGLRLDSCASGGRRNDMDIMRRAIPLHYTDVAYGKHPVKQKQMMYMNTWIPSYRSHNMDWSDDEGNYGDWGDRRDEFSYYVSMAPHITDMLAWNDSEDRYDLARKMYPIWRKAAALMLKGDYYPLTECRMSAGDIYAEQFEDTDSGEGFIRIVANTKVRAGVYTINPNTDEKRSYILTDSRTGDETVISGKALKIYTFRIAPRTGYILFYKSVADNEEGRKND